jgi:hypothetical protein
MVLEKPTGPEPGPRMAVSTSNPGNARPRCRRMADRTTARRGFEEQRTFAPKGQKHHRPGRCPGLICRSPFGAKDQTFDEPITLVVDWFEYKHTFQIKTSVYRPGAGRLSAFPFVWSYLACVLRPCSWRRDARCHRWRGKAPVSGNQPGLAASASNRTMRARGPPGGRTPRPTAPSSRSVP